MMVFEEIIEQITDTKTNAMKVRSLLFAYGQTINKKKPGKRWPQQQQEVFAT